MRWAQLVLSYFQTFAWPGVAIAAIVIFRTQIRALILKAQKISVFGAEAEFKEIDGKVKEAVKDAIADDDVNRAAGIAEGAALAHPGIGSAYAESFLYEGRVSAAIVEIGYSVIHASFDNGPDLVVQGRAGDGIVNIELKYYKEGVSMGTSTARELLSKNLVSLPRLIIITNMKPSDRVLEVFSMESGGMADLVIWRDSSDNEMLRSVLARLIAST